MPAHPTANRAKIGGTNRQVASRIIANEIGKSLTAAWDGRTGMALELPLFAVAYFAIVLFIGRGRIAEPMLAPALVGLVAVIFFHQQVTRTFWSMLGELQGGTLEQLHLSPLPARWLVLSRQLSVLVEAAVVSVILAFGVALPAEMIWDLELHIGLRTSQMTVPTLAMALGGTGFALGVVGLTLTFRRIELLIEVVFAAAFVFGGVLIPLHQLPGWMETVGRLAFPMAQPIAYARAILIEGQTLTSSDVSWGLPWLIAQPAALLVTGLTTYAIGERRARARGRLGRY